MNRTFHLKPFTQSFGSGTPATRLRLVVALVGLALLAVSVTPVRAALMTFNSATPADNTAQRSAWLTAVGVPTPQNLVDFEVGFSNTQNISGVGGLFPDGLVITDTGPGTPQAIIRSGAGAIGGSNPVGTFSLTHDEQPFLELDFSANPVDFVAFQDIDQSGATGTVTFIGGGTAAISLETTGGGGNSAEFFGIFRNDMPQITLVQLDASGDGRWGIDTIEYGVVPEPSSTATLFGLGALGWLRRKRVPQIPSR